MSRGRRLATGLDAALTAVVVVLLAVALVELAHRHRWQLDLSADGLATLDPDTVAALDLAASRGEPVTVTAFGAQAKDDEAWLRDRMMRDFLRALEAASESVHTRFVDFDRDRLTAERLGVDRYGTVVVEARGDRVDILDRKLFHARGPKGQRDVTFVGEAPVVAAIRQVLAEGGRTVVALAGHGEEAPYDRGLGDLRALASRVSEQGVALRTVDLLRDADAGGVAVPEDAAAVLVLSAHARWQAPSRRCGSTSGAGEPQCGFPRSRRSGTILLGKNTGLSLPDGVVLDPRGYFPHRRPILGYRPRRSHRRRGRGGDFVVALARRSAVSPRDGVSAAPLHRTSRQGWVERGTERPALLTAATDGAGPVTVAVAAVSAATRGPARRRRRRSWSWGTSTSCATGSSRRRRGTRRSSPTPCAGRCAATRCTRGWGGRPASGAWSCASQLATARWKVLVSRIPCCPCCSGAAVRRRGGR
ncbi:MAG: hypothetical protein R3F59_10210 [Myxococcota bacterium]